VTYKGVVCRCWDNDNHLWVHTFSAASSDGMTLWGSKVAIPGATLRPPRRRLDVASP